MSNAGARAHPLIPRLEANAMRKTLLSIERTQTGVTFEVGSHKVRARGTHLDAEGRVVLANGMRVKC